MFVPQLPDSGTAQPGGPEGPLSALPRSSPELVSQSETRSSSAAKARGVRDGAAAVEACLYSMKFGEGPCVGIVGDRGTGKSFAMRAICVEYLRRSVGLVLACDKGGKSGFAGQRRVDVADLGARPMTADPRALVFTGDPWSGVDPDPEAVAAFAWQLSARRVPTLQAVDELKWAARGGWWRKGVKWLPQSCSEGRKHDVGILWASQSPQDAPREAFEEAGVVVCYRLAGLGVDRLDERGYLRGIDRQLIEGLPGDAAPPAERGRCVILRRGELWDRCFYRF
jgi:hypothetical protein